LKLHCMPQSATGGRAHSALAMQAADALTAAFAALRPRLEGAAARCAARGLARMSHTPDPCEANFRKRRPGGCPGRRAQLHAKEGELRAAYERLAAAALERAGVRGALAAAQAELAGARAELEAWAQAGLSESRAAADDVRTAHPVAKYWVRL